MKNDLQSIHEQYKRIISEANEEPRYNNGMNEITEDKFSLAVEKAFQFFSKRVGDHWSSEEAITEDRAERFVRAIFEEFNIPVG